jgi:hypothetical protein
MDYFTDYFTDYSLCYMGMKLKIDNIPSGDAAGDASEQLAKLIMGRGGVHMEWFRKHYGSDMILICRAINANNLRISIRAHVDISNELFEALIDHVENRSQILMKNYQEMHPRITCTGYEGNTYFVSQA